MIDLLEKLRIVNNSNRKLILFCAGVHGVLFYKILKKCNIKVDFFSDNFDEKWGKIVIDDVKCVSPSVMQSSNAVVFVCVGRNHCKELTENILSEYKVEVHMISEFIDSLLLYHTDMYFDVMRQHGMEKEADLIYEINANSRFIFSDIEYGENKSAAIYTAVFGYYDNNHYSKELGNGMDLLFISDSEPNDLPDYYTWIDAKKIIPEDIISPIKRNRYIKMNPHRFLKNYDYSIYIDGNVMLEGNISSFFRKSKSGISVFMHPARECIYHEAISIVNFKRVNVDDVCQQMIEYIKQGFPLHYGLAEMPVIAREHNNSNCIRVMETWWKEFNIRSQRDQLSFMYAMWRNGFSAFDLGCLGYDVRNSDNIVFFKHSKESINIKNEIGRI